MAFTDYFYKLTHGKEIARLEEMFEIQCERIISIWQENVMYERCTSPEELRELKEALLECEDCQSENEFWIKFRSEAYITKRQEWLVEKTNEEQIRIVKNAFEVKLFITEEFERAFVDIFNNDYVPIENAYFKAIWNLHPCTNKPQEGLPAGLYIRYKQIIKILLELRYFMRQYYVVGENC
ncbi:hypothetical protein M1B78_17970 [Bacteroides sp. KH569_7]|uniref:Uncharacterized protein n=1 Tax=Bacteroides muris (ex Fokt et al. 2023) TaxID=2937417 RepID=A0A9X2P541_9BACE|nr:hypothetical protein [Bacteroides muris (ex Fokt et al. 2023)]MCR6509981.1 hypothetical protein [Bacteroides muris (ex Fokt et al. 2023)]